MYSTYSYIFFFPSTNWCIFSNLSIWSSSFHFSIFSLSKMLGLKSDPILGTTWTNCPPRSLCFILWRLGVVAPCRCPSVLRPGVLMAQGFPKNPTKKKSDPCDLDSGLKKRMLDPRGCFVLGSLVCTPKSPLTWKNHHLGDQIFLEGIHHVSHLRMIKSLPVPVVSIEGSFGLPWIWEKMMWLGIFLLWFIMVYHHLVFRCVWFTCLEGHPV